MSLKENTMSGRRIMPPSIFLYGVGGMGKTTWAASAPNPYFLFTEDGQGALDLDCYRVDNDPVLHSSASVMSAITELYTDEHEYKTVVLDTVDVLIPVLVNEVREQYGEEEAFGPKSFGKGSTYVADKLRLILDGLSALRKDRGMAVIVLGHSIIKSFAPPGIEAYDRYRPNMSERLSMLVHDWSENAFFTKMRETVVEDKGDFGKTRKRAVGRGERVMYTEERPAYWAKNRYALPHELPLDWSAFVAAMSASMSTADTNVSGNTEPQDKE